jgi:TRAP-type C4-dicarboxylate transport system substrate-binding protein
MCNKRHYAALTGIILIAILTLFAGCTSTPSVKTDTANGSTSSISPAGNSGIVELKLAHAWATTHLMQKVITTWADEVNKATNGRVKVAIYPGGTLSPANRLYISVATGALDMACMQDSDTPGKFPISSAVELPFMGDSAAVATRILYELMAKYPQINEERAGVKILYIWSTDAGQLMTANTAVRTMEDMKGMSLRVISAAYSPMAEAFGAAPAFMDAGSLSKSLKNGIVRGALLSTSAIKTMDLATVIKHTVVANIFTNTQAVVINNDAWNKISRQDQNIIMSISGQRMAEVAANAYDAEAQLAMQIAKANDMDVYTLPDDELLKWKQSMSPIYQKWVDGLNSSNLPGREILDYTMKLSEQ